MAETFENAYNEWRDHPCPSQSDVCDCPFQFPCRKCGNNVATVGESMPIYRTHGNGTCYRCSATETD